eukprot:scaffold1401_cov330-Pavlova_lutheri.AAC.67
MRPFHRERRRSVEDTRDRRTVKEKATAVLSIAIVFYLVLLGDGNRGLVLPTLNRYIYKLGGTSLELGMANSGFSLGRMLVAPLYGYWMDSTSPGAVFLFSSCVCFLCNIMYTAAGKFSDGLTVVVVSRTVLGVGASVLGIGRAYVSKVTNKSQRTAYFSFLSAIQYAGFTLFSGISLFKDAGFTVFGMKITMDTLPGLVLTLLYAIGIGSLLLLANDLFKSTEELSPPVEEVEEGNELQEPLLSSVANAELVPEVDQPTRRVQFSETISNVPETNGSDSNGVSDAEATDGMSRSSSQQSLSGAGEKVTWLAYVFILLNFSVRLVLAVLETLGPYVLLYLLKRAGQVSVPDALFHCSLFFVTVGVTGLFVFAIVWALSSCAQDRHMLAAGLILMCIGTGFLIDPHDKEVGKEISLARFAFGFTMAWAVGYPVTQTVVVSALSKVLDKKRQGLWMGHLAAAGSAGRIVGPIFAGWIYQAMDSNTAFLPFTLTFSVTSLATILVFFFWKELADNPRVIPSLASYSNLVSVPK